jgi:hypothetical protein
MRIRDKFAGSHKKGMWMGGWAPLGYDIQDHKLTINAAEAAHVRFIFERFARLRSVTKLIPILASEGIKAKSGNGRDLHPANDDPSATPKPAIQQGPPKSSEQGLASRSHGSPWPSRAQSSKRVDC